MGASESPIPAEVKWLIHSALRFAHAAQEHLTNSPQASQLCGGTRMEQAMHLTVEVLVWSKLCTLRLRCWDGLYHSVQVLGWFVPFGSGAGMEQAMYLAVEVLGWFVPFGSGAGMELAMYFEAEVQ